MNGLHLSPRSMVPPMSALLIPSSRWWQGFVLVGWLCIGSLSAAVPPAPADGIRDDTRAFSTSAREKLATQMQQVSQQTGMDLWLSAGTFLERGQTVRTLARDLRQAWSGQGDAVLVHYDRATNTLGVSLSAGVWQRFPSAEIVTLIQRSLVSLNSTDQPLESRLEQTMEALMTRLERLERERLIREQGLSSNHFHLALKYALGLAAGALGLALFGWRARRVEGEAAHEIWFPRVHVAMRLGAPHGGGVMAMKTPADDS